MSRTAINQVNPGRFTRKSFTRRKTFPDKADDYVVVIDGLVAGRIMKSVRSFDRVVCFWTMTAPYYPLKTLQHGEEETFEAAREAFKKMFWEWQAWALKQPGKATWHGAVK